MAACRAALLAKPGWAAAHVALSACLLEAGRAADAAIVAQSVLEQEPESLEAWFVRGTALSALGQGGGAVAALRQAVACRPDHAAAWLNLGNAHADRDELDLAERHIRTAIAHDPSCAEARASLGWLLGVRGDLAGAVRACTAAIELRPGFARAHWNRSFAHLLAGDYAQGWRDYEWRRHDPTFARDLRVLPGPEWDGGDLTGQHLLVYASQGLGDTIQFARFLPALARQAAKVTLACAAPLTRLLGQLPVAVIDQRAPLPRYDCWIDQMSLPRLLDLRPDAIPGSAGYISFPTAPSRDAVPAGLRVGLVWSGNPAHSNDRRRSMPAHALAPLLATPGVSFTSLQAGPRGGELAILGVADRSGQLSDFAATAAAIADLDLVIAVDTATAHLAGALGRPVWLLLAHSPDWRWMTGRAETPWYGSARLFRQATPGDWAGVVRRVAEALTESSG